MPDFSRQSYIIYDWPKTKAVPSDEWEEKRLRSLADVVGGGTPDTGIYSYWNPPSIPWVTPTDISACDGIFLTLDPQVFQTDGVTGSKVRGKVLHKHAIVEILLWTARR